MRSRLNCFSRQELVTQWTELRQAEPHLRMRNAADKIGVSEAAMVWSGAGYEAVEELDNSRFSSLIGKLAKMGGWMYLVRNDHAVLEHDLSCAEMSNGVGEIELSARGFSLQIETGRVGKIYLTHATKGPRRMIQIFDTSGVAIAKVVLKDANRLKSLPDTFGDGLIPVGNEMPVFQEPAIVAKAKEKDLDPSLIGVSSDSYVSIFETAVVNQTKVTLSVENAAARMSVSHLPKRLEVMGPWFNILDRGFNLHLMESGVESAYRNQTSEGSIYRFYDSEGNLILTLTI